MLSLYIKRGKVSVTYVPP